MHVGFDKHGVCCAVPAATLPLFRTAPHLPSQTPNAPRHVLAAEGLQSSEARLNLMLGAGCIASRSKDCIKLRF
jgi:hypothetical protein